MKPLHLNLAARPYRDERPFWLIVGTLALLTLVLMIYNARTAYRFFVNTEETRAEIAEVEARVAGERSRLRELRGELATVDLRRLRAQVEYVNTQLAERAFSWNALLEDLERVVPRDVRLLSLRPQVSGEGPVALNLVCISKTDDGLVELIRAMIADSRFDQPYPISETRTESGQTEFVLRVGYLPPRGPEVTR
ncbi:MAG TPA: hypothetical protein VM534_06520 [Thermoanaerobaculia bacterium]|nr:hypothetical protein [Thermoanaerobaculia bacterium]